MKYEIPSEIFTCQGPYTVACRNENGNKVFSDPRNLSVRDFYPHRIFEVLFFLASSFLGNRDAVYTEKKGKTSGLKFLWESSRRQLLILTIEKPPGKASASGCEGTWHPFFSLLLFNLVRNGLTRHQWNSNILTGNWKIKYILPTVFIIFVIFLIQLISPVNHFTLIYTYKSWEYCVNKILSRVMFQI